METFLAFLAHHIPNQPGTVKPLDGALAKRVADLVKCVSVAGDEPLGDDSLL